MSNMTDYILEWEYDTSVLMDICEHDKPDNAIFCPQCGIPIGFDGQNERIKQWIEKELQTGLERRGHSMTSWCSWYNHDVDMLALSSAFPYILFDLTGYGGASNYDVWRKYYFDETCERVEGVVVFDECTIDKWIQTQE